jgi:hypothetical protein
MSSYFKTKIGSERGKSNGFIARLMLCRSRQEMFAWFNHNPKQIVEDDIKFYSDKYDITLPENANIAKVINKLREMIGE